MPEETYVSIKVVDVLGRLVRSLINEQRIAGGYHHIKWDGLTDSGISASSGVYLIHFSGNNYNSFRLKNNILGYGFGVKFFISSTAISLSVGFNPYDQYFYHIKDW